MLRHTRVPAIQPSGHPIPVAGLTTAPHDMMAKLEQIASDVAILKGAATPATVVSRPLQQLLTTVLISRAHQKTGGAQPFADADAVDSIAVTVTAVLDTAKNSPHRVDPISNRRTAVQGSANESRNKTAVLDTANGSAHRVD